ncbi:GGDEF and EAL domain-containing protein [Luteimonas vadosa]|uniref:EAL domain-containing protein n=1 Tax=Luteimonas vadosa TaxID=1165507 RepID=A0ABP9DR14_9GAMM
MPSALASQVDRPDAGEAARHAAALRVLTRTVWHPDCTFDTALAEISRTAAETLEVGRVNVWRLERDACRLACIHAYDLRKDEHACREELETLPLDAAYASQLDSVRVITYDDVGAGVASTPTSREWKAYFQRHGIQSLLDAPVLVEGELQGVICHEHLDEPRNWSPGQKAFAGSMGDFVAMALEIVRRRNAEEEVSHLKLHDGTTNLPNRDFLLEALSQRMHVPQSVDQLPAVVHVKVGLAQGAPLPGQSDTMEDVHAQVASRLRALVDDGVQLSRVRPDGFAFVPGATWSQRDVVHLAERCVEAAQNPLDAASMTRIQASVGVAFAEPGDSDARKLLRQAEQASEQALSDGGQRFQVFDAGHHQRLVQRLELEGTLWRAFNERRFEVHFQPEVCLDSGRWLGAEALMRWRRDGEVVVAGEFIDAAESCGLVVPLGEWVLEQACQSAAAWPAGPEGRLPGLRVNLSTRQFESCGLADMVAGCLERAGLAADRLCLEITETTLMRDLEAARALIVSLRRLGVSIAIDDFGTGYSSFAHLKQFPIDVLKLDRSFVAGVPGNQVDQAIVSAVRALATGMGVVVVVEGVETRGQADWLRDQGFRLAQGFLFASALPDTELLARFA